MAAATTTVATSAAEKHSIADLVANAREAQRQWGRNSIRNRLKIIRKVRDRIAADALRLAAAFPPVLVRSRADSLTTEIIPLAEACRFLELQAGSILASKRLSNKGRVFWLGRVQIDVHREPHGVVLIIGPSNYPLFLAATQALQALAAGNAVLLKPGRGASKVLGAFSSHLAEAGVPDGLFTLLAEEVEAAITALRSGVDLVALTGSVNSGKAVLREAAENMIPAIVELSGQDPVFVRADADLEKAVSAIAFGAEMNGGNTCIAPRRIFVDGAVADDFRRKFDQANASLSSIPVTAVKSDEEAVYLASQNPYALGATIFGEEHAARKLAKQIRAGVVVINDTVVPTADPRVSFGGRGWSGFGSTRGAEGLLQMTTPKVVVVQRAKRLRHLESPPLNSEALFLAYLEAKHRSGGQRRWKGWQTLIKQVLQTRKGVNDRQ